MATMADFRRIVKNHQYEEIDGMVVDAFTANMMCKVYNNLSGPVQAKMEDLLNTKPLNVVVDRCWSVIRNVGG